MSEITETRWVTREQSRILTNLRSRVRRQRSTSAMCRAVDRLDDAIAAGVIDLGPEMDGVFVVMR